MATKVTESGYIDHTDFSEDGFLCRDGGEGTYSSLKVNLSATSGPTPSDDSSSGYAVGSVWVDTTNDKAYQCVDSTTSAAIWKETTAPGGGSAVSVEDEGVELTAGVQKLNFVGPGVTASEPVADEITVTVSGSAEVDCQSSSSATETSTTSTTFVDLDSMTLNTSNTSSKKYAVDFNSTFAGSNNEGIQIRLMVDGVADASTVREIHTTGTSDKINMGTIALTAPLSTGKTIKIQWLTSSSTAYSYDRCLRIYGVS